MNTWKHGIIGIIAVIAITFTACPPEPDPKKDTKPKAGDIIVSSTGIELAYIPAGTFEMGKDLGTARASFGDETPVHTVTLAGFYMGKYEVTQGQYQTVMGALPSNLDSETNTYGKGNNYPVYYVSWYDAIEFCNALSVLEGLTPYYSINKGQPDPNNTNSNDTFKWLVTPNTNANGYRLPTEAQWEYAAKGGNTGETFTYSGSDDPAAVAWCYSNGGETSKQVGTKAPNGLGLYDMSGNVYEWCWDWYGDYTNESQTNPTGASSGSRRVLRGGSWDVPAELVSSAFRVSYYPNDRLHVIGFRLVRP